MKPYLVTAALLLTLTHVKAHGQDQAAAVENARAVAQQLVQQLGAELRKALSAGGPAAAITVCKVAAPEIAGRLSRSHGAKVARVSLKVRNPMLGLPDAWEQEMLTRFEQRLKAGEKPDAIEHAEVVAEPTGRYLRYMRAIPVQPLCLSCHGDRATHAPEVAEVLAREYPHDLAFGYTVGQLRGAVTIKQPLVTP